MARIMICSGVLVLLVAITNAAPSSFSQASAQATSIGGGHSSPSGPRGIGGPGGPNQGFGGHNQGFGGHNSGFGSSNQGFGGSRPGIGGPNSGFGNNRPSSQGSKGLSISISKSVNIGGGNAQSRSQVGARGK
ncbi:ATP-dependent RNA helicase glh-1-like [Pectinophora gossypiella]|uniref:ATP-dependent RNA helicase glh-1-like n=1 Tax=Pectinophora gossypiella TaxID=13191 RepID=UPI00214E9021|nr:ATP-dependent RNA helicase glh-1-like [Pectinophora gossypiella]